MGATSDRITAEDFLTPPELQERRLAATAAGRIGGTRLELTGGPGGTRLGRCYQQIPLRVLPPFQFGPDQPALVYLLNPTAGLMDGDAQRMEIHAGPGTRAVVAGQSATRIHPCLEGFSTQQWHIRVESGAVLALLPGPAIPFRGCRFYQRVAIDLAADAGLAWGDLWLSGRYARGTVSEQFQFETIVQDLTVQRDGLPVFRDRFCWQGPWDQETALWHFGSSPACGSLFVSGSVSEEIIKGTAGAEPAMLPTAAGDTCLRWCGASEAVTGGLVHAALHSAAALAGARAGTRWLPSDDLAPVHWFTPQGEW